MHGHLRTQGVRESLLMGFPVLRDSGKESEGFIIGAKSSLSNCADVWLNVQDLVREVRGATGRVQVSGSAKQKAS